jgi:hypothetical protein
MLKKILRSVALVLLLGLLGLAASLYWLHEPRPQAQPSPEADALARRMMEAVNDSAWRSVGAVQWSFRGVRRHVWDRRRHLAQVSWGSTTVWIDLSTRKGKAAENGQALQGEALEEALENAWKYWCNDSFWLNPIAKFFDEGTTRSLVPLPQGGQGVLVAYAAGGVTPGDAYLWEAGPDGKPERVRMWVQLLPIGGVSFAWKGWKQEPSGAWLAHRHLGLLGSLDLEDVATADSAEALLGTDPFAGL